MQKQRGKFIVIEGIDGAGKTSQVNRLAKRITAEFGWPCHTTRECSDGPIGKLLRGTYLSGKREADERIINTLYAADRLDHITNKEDGILKYLDEGINVICDRYVMSSLAYDTYMYIGTNDYLDAMDSIVQRNKVNLDLLTPDLTIVINTPPVVAMERMKKERASLSVYEDPVKLEKIYLSYSMAMTVLKDKFHHHIECVDGEGSPDSVAEEIWMHIRDMAVGGRRPL